MNDDPVVRFLMWWHQFPAVVKLVTLAFCFGTVGWAVLRLVRRSHIDVEAMHRKVAENAEASNSNPKGKVDVDVVFHTYRGFLFFVFQTKHQFRANPDSARSILWSLHKSNCTWGLLALGGFFVPLISYLNYLAQKRSIRSQEAKTILDDF